MSDSEKKGPTYDQLSGYDKALLETALKRGATRREVMSWLIASGATIASAGSIVTAAGEALAQTPKKGGKIKLAYDLHGPSDTLDPVLFTSSIDYGRGPAAPGYRRSGGAVLRCPADQGLQAVSKIRLSC